MTTFERLQKVINTELSIDVDKIKEDSHLFDDLNFDSLDAIEMILALEGEFDIEIPDDDVDDLRTVQQLITFINENS